MKKLEELVQERKKLEKAIQKFHPSNVSTTGENTDPSSNAIEQARTQQSSIIDPAALKILKQVMTPVTVSKDQR